MAAKMYSKEEKNDKITIWQLPKFCPKERNFYLLTNDLMSDVTLIVGVDKVRIPSHKLILSLTSNVFYERLFVTTPNISELIIEDIEVPVFMKFLEYIYTGVVKLNDLMIPGIRKLAKRYDISHLQSLCEQYKPIEITVDNVIQIFGENSLNEKSRNKCLDIISTETLTILRHKSFLNASVDTVCKILKLPKLQCREIELYQAVSKWVDMECSRRNLELTNVNKRSLLGDSFYSIRLPTLTLDELRQCIKDNEIDKLLTKTETDQLFHYCGNYINRDGEENIKFIKSPRYVMSGIEHNKKHYKICCIFKLLEMDCSKQSRKIPVHRIKFSVSKPMTLCGIGILVHASNPIPANMNIFKIRLFGARLLSVPSFLPFSLVYNEKIKSKNFYQMKFGKDIIMCRLFFAPQNISPDKFYMIQIENHPQLHFVVGKLRRQFDFDDYQFKFDEEIVPNLPCLSGLSKLIYE